MVLWQFFPNVYVNRGEEAEVLVLRLLAAAAAAAATSDVVSERGVLHLIGALVLRAR
jgi:hypothetical protein